MLQYAFSLSLALIILNPAHTVISIFHDSPSPFHLSTAWHWVLQYDVVVVLALMEWNEGNKFEFAFLKKTRTPCVCARGLLWIWTIYQFYFLRFHLSPNASKLFRARFVQMEYNMKKSLSGEKKKLNYANVLMTSGCSWHTLKISFCDDMRFMLWSVSEKYSGTISAENLTAYV